MTTGLLIIAHAPLASALRSCVLHVFPEAAPAVAAYDVPASEAPEASLGKVKQLAHALGTERLLVMTDVIGATPSNIARRLVDGPHVRLVAGVNLPMLLRTVNYRDEALDPLVQRALTGGAQCIMQVSGTLESNPATP